MVSLQRAAWHVRAADGDGVLSEAMLQHRLGMNRDLAVVGGYLDASADV